jgi:signal transduction histidine kinase/ligand-binding sensor domain-containing protein
LRKLLLFCFLSLVCNEKNSAQAPEFNFQRIGVNEGLSQGSVRDIVEDNTGFLWIATADGLNRFDGYDFYAYHHHDEDSTSIANGDVKKIFKDGSGDLWLATASGLSKYNRFFDTFKKVKGSENDGEFAFYEDAKHDIFAINAVGTIFIIDKNNVLQKQSIACPFELGNENFFFTTKDELVFIFLSKKMIIFDCKTKKWNETTLPNQLKMPTAAFFFKNQFWIGNNVGELLHYDANFKFLEKIKFSAVSINSIYSFGNADLLVGTDEGLFFYSPFSKEKKKYQYNIDNLRTLSANGVSAFHTDNSGNLWIGTNTSGLNKSIYSNKKFNIISASSYYQVKGMWKDDATGELFCAVHRKGIDIYDLVAEQKTPTTIFTTKNYNFIVPLDNNHLLLVHNNGFDKLDRTTNLITAVGDIFSPIFGKNSVQIKAFFQQDDKLYSVVNQSLVVMNNDGKFTNKVAATLTNVNDITSLCVEDDKYFIGSSKGFYEGNVLRIPNIFVKSILVDADNTLWIASTSGLVHFFPNNNTFKIYDEKYGLENNFMYGVLKDNNGNLWCSTNRGLARFNPLREYFRNYGLSEGVQALEYNTNAFVKSKDGMMIFGGVGGINYFNTEMIAENPVAPRPLISALKVNDEEIKTDTAIWQKKFIELPYAQNTISFEFVGIQYTNTERNEYQYWLVGVDKDWINAGNKRFARYANLDPGVYTFRVKAANSDGRWNVREATITIKITAPFWLTWWFRALAILSFLGALSAIIFYYQQRKIRQQRRQLEIQERVIKERERISRDLHDNIGAQITYIISSMDWAKSQVPKENAALQDRFDHLRSNTQSLMSSLRDTIWTLNKKAISPQDFFDRLRQYIGYNVQRNGNIEVTFFENITDERELMPNVVLNLFRICQEAVQNVVKHAEAHVLTLSLISEAGESLKIAITDDGKGFDNTDRCDDSFGLDNMRYRAQEIGATINIRSAVGKGTSIEIILETPPMSEET